MGLAKLGACGGGVPTAADVSLSTDPTQHHVSHMSYSALCASAPDHASVAVCVVLQIPVLLLHNVWRGNPWTKVDLCIGKIAELYGD